MLNTVSELYMMFATTAYSPRFESEMEFEITKCVLRRLFNYQWNNWLNNYKLKQVIKQAKK